MVRLILIWTFFNNDDVIRVERKTAECWVINSTIQKTARIWKKTTNGDYYNKPVLKVSCFFQAHYYPQTITETILFDLVPEIGLSKQKNVLERLWAYLTIQDLLKRVARYQIIYYWIPRQTMDLIWSTKKRQNNCWNSG